MNRLSKTEFAIFISLNFSLLPKDLIKQNLFTLEMSLKDCCLMVPHYPFFSGGLKNCPELLIRRNSKDNISRRSVVRFPVGA